MFTSKNVFFKNVYAFLPRRIATFNKLYETGTNRLLFSSEEKYSHKKMCVAVEHVRWKNDKLVLGGTSFWITKSWILIG